MGLFGKKKKEVKLEEPPAFRSPLDNLPELPEIPELKIPEIKLKDIGTEKLKPIETLPSQPKEQSTPIQAAQTLEEMKVGETKLEAPLVEEKPSELAIKGPIFVKIAKYKKVLNTVEKINEEIVNLEKDIKRLLEIKNEEDSEIKKISEELAEIKRKTKEIETNLFAKLE